MVVTIHKEMSVGQTDQHLLLNTEYDGTNSSALTTDQPVISNTTDQPTNESLPCQWILYSELNNSRVRLWDVVILVPNALFLLFLLLRIRIAISKLRNTSSPIFLAFYGLVCMTAIISVLRCVVSMTVDASSPAGGIADKVLWLLLRFFMLATELSVITFGLAFGHLDSRTSIQRVLLVTFTVALAYSTTQGVLEFKYPDDRFHVTYPDREYDIFGHGGMLFWLTSSTFFFVIYSVICILPFTVFRRRFALPHKKSFYMYCGFLSILNLLQAVGSGFLYYHIHPGLCIVDATTYIYFTCFAPMVYFTFLWVFFRTSTPNSVLFSYKAQTDEAMADEDSVSLPYQVPHDKMDGDTVVSGSYDSTHFDTRSPNPLYHNELALPINSQRLVIDFYDKMTQPTTVTWETSLSQN